MLLKKMIWVLVLIAASSTAWSQKLIFAIDLIRHGDRTPIFLIPATASYHQEEGRGQLTSEGMQQEYQLGVRARKIYVDECHLLPAHYSRQTLYVQSSDYDRTLMSATSFLLGLYPLGSGPYLIDSKVPALPQAFQPIPIHTLPQKEDTALVPRADRKKFAKLLETYVFQTPSWQEKEAKLKTKYPAWGGATGIHLTKLEQLASLGNSLYIDQLHHMPLPPALSPADIEEIIHTGQWVTDAMFKPEEIGRIGGHDLLTMLNAYFEDVTTTQGHPLKYVLLSAHDSTILMAMSAMKVPLEEVPPFASVLNFSLYETRPHSYSLKISYNGKLLSLPACHGSTCTLKQFKTLLHHPS